MPRSVLVLLCVAISLLILPGAALAAGPTHHYKAGAPGAGDPYFPLDGNGGYNVRHYDLAISYDPTTARLKGVATIEAKATQDLSRFDLDFDGLTIRSLTIDGHGAKYRRDGQELIVTPRHGIPNHQAFTVKVRYDGTPKLIDDPALGANGWFQTDDGALMIGEPHVPRRGSRSTTIRPTRQRTRSHHRPARHRGRVQRRAPRPLQRSPADVLDLG